MAYYRIVYTTRTRTTARIAERLAVRLRSQGQRAVACTLATSPQAELGERLVIASPVNGMKVLPEFALYCRELVRSAVPVFGIFLVSAIAPTGRRFWRRIMEAELARYTRMIGAKASHIFGGYLDRPMPAPARFIFGLKRDLPLDQVDENAIDAWADSLIATESGDAVST